VESFNPEGLEVVRFSSQVGYSFPCIPAHKLAFGKDVSLHCLEQLRHGDPIVSRTRELCGGLTISSAEESRVLSSPRP